VDKYIAAHGGKEAFTSIKSAYTEMDIFLNQQQISYKVWIKDGDKIRTEQQAYGKEIVTVIKGDQGWIKENGKVVKLDSDQVREMRIQTLMNNNLSNNYFVNYKEKGYSLFLNGVDTLNNIPYDVVSVKVDLSATFKYYIDRATGLEYKYDIIINDSPNPNAENISSVEVYTSEFKNFGALKSPTVFILKNGSMQMKTVVKKFEVNKLSEDKYFNKPY
jgi:hypothetical protein